MPTERDATTAGASAAPDHSAETPAPASLPFAWSAVDNDDRDSVFVSDSVIGAYTVDLSVEPARGDDGHGPVGRVIHTPGEFGENRETVTDTTRRGSRPGRNR